MGACDELCGELWRCMQDHCPAVDPDLDFEARCGGIGEDICEALAPLVDGGDCPTTLAHISGVSPGFDERCGFEGQRDGQTSCVQRCDELWSCTQQNPALCPEFIAEREADFKEVCHQIAPCDALDTIVDPGDCELTVRVMSTVHDKFGDNCEAIDVPGVFVTQQGDIHIHQCGACRIGQNAEAAGFLWLLALAIAMRWRRGCPAPPWRERPASLPLTARWCDITPRHPPCKRWGG